VASLKRLLYSFLILATATLLQSSSQTCGQTSDPKSKSTGSISGRVTLGGSAAEGIPVVAVSGQTVNRRDAAARFVTDSEGRYRLSGLAPGQYQIWAVAPGLIVEPGPSSRYGFPYYGSIQNIILGANEDVSDIDLKLVRGAVITGRVTDAENKPVAEERVTLQLLDSNGNPRLGALRSTSDQMNQTDDRGIYRIYGLPAGGYKVSVGSDPNEGFTRRVRHQQTFYPDTTDQSKATIVELKEGGEAKDIDIKVGSPTQTYAVSGYVIDAETGLPIGKAGVRLMVVRQDQGPPSPGSFGAQADERGEFSFDGFASGHYSAYATSEPYGGNFYGDPVYFEVIDKDVSGLELKAIPGLTVSGVVVADGMMTKDLLALLPGLRVSARVATSSNSQISGGGSVAVAPDGTFEVSGLRPGRVSMDVYAQMANFTRPSIARIEHDGIGISQGFDIQQSVSGLRVVINYGTGAIRGTVRLEGASFSDSLIYVNCKREGARDGTVAQVDARGHFILKDLAPGVYEVTLQVVVGGPTRPQRPPPPQKQQVNVTNGSESEVTFVVNLAPKQGGP
jgi:Carboxypeptidase regulatory-like domain